MTDNSIAMPLYHQVAGLLRQRVAESVYPVGAQLPPEDDLASEFGVSRATVRQAVGMLVSEGLLTRRQGRGTYVATRESRVLSQRFRGSLVDLIQQSYDERPRDIEVMHKQPFPEHVADELQVTEPYGTIVQQIRMMNSEPIGYSISWLPESIGKVLTAPKLRKDALIEILLKQGIKIQSATQTIRSDLADVPICHKFGVELGAAILYVERTVFDSTNRPIDFVRSWYRGDRYDYVINLEIGDLTAERRSVSLVGVSGRVNGDSQ